MNSFRQIRFTPVRSRPSPAQPKRSAGSSTALTKRLWEPVRGDDGAVSPAFCQHVLRGRKAEPIELDALALLRCEQRVAAAFLPGEMGLARRDRAEGVGIGAGAVVAGALQEWGPVDAVGPEGTALGKPGLIWIGGRCRIGGRAQRLALPCLMPARRWTREVECVPYSNLSIRYVL